MEPPLSHVAPHSQPGTLPGTSCSGCSLAVFNRKKVWSHHLQKSCILERKCLYLNEFYPFFSLT